MNRNAHIQNLLFVLGSLAFTALLAEILLRALLPPPIVWKYPQETYLFDAEIGHRLKPNHQAFTHDKIVNINSQGVRGAEYSSKPAQEVTRVLALGDSQTFGNGLVQADTWPKQLERKLNGHAVGSEYEVLNGGLPASDTWQHEILMQRLMSAYSPDIVVLAFYVNDVVRKPASIKKMRDDKIGLVGWRLVYLLKRSVLLLSLRAAYDVAIQSIRPRRGFLLQNALLAGESNPEVDGRWAQVEQSLLKMKEVAAKSNISFLVVSLPRRDQVDSSLSADKYNEQLSAMIKKTGVSFMNMLEPLQQAYKAHDKALFIPWDGHNTAVANRVIAGEIAVAIRGLTVGGLE